MSFDLHFHYRPDAPPMTWHALRDWAERNAPAFQTEDADEDGELVYDNRRTGVYFVLYWFPRKPSEDADENDPDREPDDPADQAMAPVSFNLNFCRPSFFGLEALSIVAAMAEAFQLDVVDPQGDNEPQAPNADALFASYDRSNQWASRAIADLNPGRPSMPRDHATAWWRYMRDHEALVEAMDIPGGFAPRVFLVTRGDGQVRRAAVLTGPTMYVIPPADIFLVDRDGERCFIEARRFLDFIEPWITRDDPDALGHPWVSEMTIYDSDVSDRWQAFYDSVPSDGDPEDLEGVAVDGFVEV